MITGNNYLELCKISKKYKDNYALKDINLTLTINEIVGLIGCNGAGKSTLFKIIAKLIFPTSGVINIQGFNSEIGYLPEILKSDVHLTIKEYFDIYNSGISQTKNYQEKLFYYLERYNLEYKSKIKNLSKGMFQKLFIIHMLLKNCDLYLLDEPTDSLDPIARMNLFEDLRILKMNGKLVVVSSHSLAELELLCDKFILLQNGMIKDIIDVNEIRNKVSTYNVFIDSYYQTKIIELNIFNDFKFIKEDDFIIVSIKGETSLNDILKILNNNGITVVKIISKTCHLNEYFLEKCGK